jgi:hypothetical protein
MFSHIKVNKMFDKLFALAMTGLLTASGTAVLSTLSIFSAPLTPSANAQAQAQKYKVTMWYVIDNSNDGPFDNTLELYSELQVGSVRGTIKRTSPRSRERGNTLHLGTTRTITDSSIIINASLMDRDEGTSDDQVFMLENYSLDLANNVGKQVSKSYTGPGGEAATLHMLVEKVQ